MIITKYTDLNKVCDDDVIVVVPIEGDCLNRQFECIWNCYQTLLDMQGISHQHTIRLCTSDTEFDYNVAGNLHYKSFSEANFTLHSKVALGGTFDRLHYGHKVLLTLGAMIAKDRLVVGVTCDQMASRKVRADKLQRVEERIQNVTRFLDTIKCETYKVIKLNDPYGPTIEDSDISALVVTEETVQGANSSTDILTYQ